MLTGIVRSVDDLGRIVILMEWRRELGISHGSLVEISRKGDTLVINVKGNIEESTGIIRKIDSLGRIVIPKEWRDELKIGPSTPIEMSKKGSVLKLAVKSEVCCICGNKPNEDEAILMLHEKIICSNCEKVILGKKRSRN